MTRSDRTDRQPPVRALHINWTAPFFWRQRRERRHPPRAYALTDAHILTTMLSALTWREYHGPIWMYTDRAGADCYIKLGLADLYQGIDESVLGDRDLAQIHPRYFAAGKLFVYRAAPLPFVQIDTDLALRRPLRSLTSTDVLFAHWEARSRPAYPGREALLRPRGFEFPRAWRWSMNAMNCAILKLSDAEHRLRYTDLAIRYLLGSNRIGQVHPLVPMVFAEQRIVAFEAERRGLKYEPVVSATWMPATYTWRIGNQQRERTTPAVERAFHHTWMMKSRFSDPVWTRTYCYALLSWLAEQFPEELGRLDRIRQLHDLLSDWERNHRPSRRRVS